MLFAWLAPEIKESDLPPFEANEEVSERVLADESVRLAFPTHRHWAAKFFSGIRWIDGLTAGGDPILD